MTIRCILLRSPWAVGIVVTAVLSSIWSANCESRPMSQFARDHEKIGKDSPFASDLKSGDEVFSVDPAIIIGIDYQTPTRTVTVEPSKGRRYHFQLTISDLKTGKVTQCGASAALYTTVMGLTSIRAERVLELHEAQSIWSRYESNAATLRIRDSLNTDAKEFRVILIDGPPRAVVLRDYQYLFVPSLHPEWFDQFTKGCSRN